MMVHHAIDPAPKGSICHSVAPNTMTLVLPPNYVERSPRRSPWTAAALPPPSFAFTTQVLLQNGETTSAVWTGKLWWGSGAELDPIGWRWVENCAITHGPKGQSLP